MAPEPIDFQMKVNVLRGQSHPPKAQMGGRFEFAIFYEPCTKWFT